ncbi:MAG: nucleotidyl transferase AbiEii/AbiGii toxin family protein [Candidatus Pacebacteria bacterium]|nr:nucleotidyl transferase AbiEii/AbiGii toxin family protein [Candidatus Paceibacterota bacterium]MDD3919373.1 nucleotidyl transferase AbiEii/AbiGii toxin family protein [Candidatus Paceibacterota bacterium]
MLNRQKHQLIMGKILKDIYTDISISSLLGFKGGTCAYFFYNLPRFSVDLDFDLLDNTLETQELVFEKIKKILSKYGDIKNSYIKRFTIFVLMSYGTEDDNIKVEINVRDLFPNTREYYQLKDYLGVSMLVANEEFLFSNKLAALTLRKKIAMRDVYDINYFAKNNWNINEGIIKFWTDKKTETYLEECISFIENIKDNKVLLGLGELVSTEEEKNWIRNNLKKDTIFMLKNYISILK